MAKTTEPLSRAASAAADRLRDTIAWQLEDLRRAGRREAAELMAATEPWPQETARGYRVRILQALKTGVSGS